MGGVFFFALLWRGNGMGGRILGIYAFFLSLFFLKIEGGVKAPPSMVADFNKRQAPPVECLFDLDRNIFHRA